MPGAIFTSSDLTLSPFSLLGKIDRRCGLGVAPCGASFSAYRHQTEAAFWRRKAAVGILPDRSSSDEKNYHPRPGRYIRRRARADSPRADASAPRRTDANIPATDSAVATATAAKAGRCFAGFAIRPSAGSERRW